MWLKLRTSFLVGHLLCICLLTAHAQQEEVTMWRNIDYVVTNTNPADSHFFNALKLMIISDLKGAESEFKHFLKRGKDNNAANFYLSVLNFLKNEFKTALKYSKQAYEADTTNRWYRVFYANLLAYNGELKKGAQLYAGLTDLYGHKEEFYWGQIRFQYELKRYDLVLDLIDSMGKYTIQDDDFLDELRMNIYGVMDDTLNFEKVLLKVMERNPEDASYRYRLVRFYQLTGQKDKLLNYQDVLAPEKDKNSHYRQAYLYGLFAGDDSLELKDAMHELFVVEKDDEAISDFFAVLAKSNEFPQMSTWSVLQLKHLVLTDTAHYLASEFLSVFQYKLGNIDSACYYGEISLAAGSRKESMYEFMAETYYDEGLYEDVKRICKGWININGENSYPYYIYALAALNLKEYDKSKHFLAMSVEKARKEEGRNKKYLAELYSYLGYLSEKENDTLLTRAYYDSALHYAPNNRSLLNQYAYWLANIGVDLEKALEYSKKSLVSDANNPHYLDTYAWILYKMGRYEEAREYQLKALKHADKDRPTGVFHDHMGDIEYKLGNRQEAVKHWKKALEFPEEEGLDIEEIGKKIKENE